MARTAKETALRGWVVSSTAKVRAFLGWAIGTGGVATVTSQTIIYGSCYLVQVITKPVLVAVNPDATLVVSTPSVILRG